MLVINVSRQARWKWTAALIAASLLIFSALQEPRVDVAPVLALPVAGAKLMPIYKVNTREKKIALTFDISWGTKMYGPVLDILKQENVISTFFLSGPWSARHPDVVRRIAAEGHQVESHGHKHDNFSRLGPEGVVDNLQKADTILTELAGKKPKLVRPPNGDFDDVSLQATESIGYKTVIWSVDSRDWMNPGVDAIVDRVLKLTGPGDVILMHASDSCKQTDQALPAIIKGLREKGFEFVTMDELLTLGEPIIPTFAPADAEADEQAGTLRDTPAGATTDAPADATAPPPAAPAADPFPPATDAITPPRPEQLDGAPKG